MKSLRSPVGLMPEEERKEAEAAAVKAHQAEVDKANEAFSILWISMNEDMKSVFAYVPIGDAHGLWKALETKYESKTMSNKLSVRRQLQECTMEEHEHVDTYLARFMQLVLQLADMGVVLTEDEKINTFMMGLPSSLGPFMDALEISQTKLTMSSMVEHIRNHQEKQQLKSRREEALAHMARERNRFKTNPRESQGDKSSEQRSSVRCFNCGGLGHVRSKCSSEQIGDGFTHSNRTKPRDGQRPNRGETGTALQSTRVPVPDRGRCDTEDFGMSGLALMASQESGSGSGSKHDYRLHLAEWDSDHVEDDEDDHVNSSIQRAASGNSVRHTDVAFGAHTLQPTASDVVEFLLDSGASRTNVVDQQLLTEIKRASSPVSIKIANKEIVELDKVGKSNLVISHEGGKKVVPLNDVVFAPSFAANLLSVGDIVEKQCGVLFTKQGALVVKLSGDGKCILSFGTNVKPTVESGGESVMNVPKVGNMFIHRQKRTDMMKASKLVPHLQQKRDQSYLTAEEQKNALDLWHRRLGHISLGELKKLIDSNGVTGLENLQDMEMSTIDDVRKNKFCESCVMGKSHRQPFTGHLHQPAKEIMDRWHGDLQGPIRVEQTLEAVTTAGGNLYWFNIVDEKSHQRLSRAIALKSSATDVLIEIIKRAQVHTGKKLKEFHSDDGGEFRSEKLQRFFKDNGTKHTVTQRATPQHNPIAERDGRTVMNMVVSMLHQSGLPAQFWAAAAAMAVYVLNRTVNASNLEKTPYEQFVGFRPSAKALRVFGCDGYVNVMREDRNKLEPKAVRAIYIGPDESKKGHRMFSVETKRVIISRDVVFHESSFGFARELYGNNSQILKSLIVESANGHREVITIDDDDSDDSIDNGGAQAASSARAGVSPLQNLAPSHQPVVQNSRARIVLPPMIEQEEKDFDIDEIVRADPPHIGRLPIQAQAPVPAEAVLPALSGRQQRNRQPPRGLDDSVSWDQVRLGRGQKIAYNMMAVVPVEVYSKTLMHNKRGTEIAFLGMEISSTRQEDRVFSYQEAIASDDKAEWKKAMNEEILSLLKNQTWMLVERPVGVNVMDCKWVLRKKFNSAGELVRYKARLCAMGYTQKLGIDYHETFAPVVKYKSLRILLVLANLLDYEVKHMDVETAFLNATMKEEVYMRQPPGYDNGQPDVVCKLLKSIYGTKQAPHDWNADLNRTLTQLLGFRRCITDTCVYTKQSKTGRMILLAVFVDDLTPMYHREDESEWNALKGLLMNQYHMKDLGDVDWLLRMKITRDREKRTITISQEAYIDKMVDQYGLKGKHSYSIPAEQLRLTMSEDEPVMDKVGQERYGSMVGSVMYAALSTRPDISFATNAVSRFLSQPSSNHAAACERIIVYLKGTKNMGLVYKNDNGLAKSLIINAYCDADWGGDPVDARSTTGYVIQLNGCSVAWCSRKQPTTALSSAEAEYMAMSEAVKEILWLKQLLQEIMPQVPVEPAVLYCDNQAAIAISKNDVHHDRTKHINIRYHFIRETIVNKEIEVEWVQTSDQLADVLTKPVGRNRLTHLRERIMGSQKAMDLEGEC